MIPTIFLLLASATSGQPSVPEENCFLLRGESRIDVPGLSVIQETASGAFKAPIAKPGDAVMCERDHLLPEANDFKVLVAGFPLIISSSDGRIATLEINSGKVQFRTLQGEFTDAEIPSVQNYLDSASDAIKVSAP